MDGEINGDVDFTALKTPQQINAAFDVWESAVQLIKTGKMPPANEPRLTSEEVANVTAWYTDRFVINVQASPGPFLPRRLAAHEYRNTLHTLLGFELEVAIVEAEQTVSEKSLIMKLLPTDPPGPSGFTNDTSGNPLTTTIWDQYSYLADNGLEKLFSPPQRSALEQYTGPISGAYITNEQAQQLLRRFIRKAYRRDVSDDALSGPLSALAGLDGQVLQQQLQRQLKRVLMSPTFIYRGLLLNIEPDKAQPVDDWELAERLSYFLWADMPDDELFNLAAKGQLHEREVLSLQVDRLLKSPRARSLAEDFGSAWFSLREIEKASNNPPFADALLSQPLDFLNYLFTEDRPVLELIDSNVTFINPHTSRFYPRDRGQMTKYQKQKGIEVEIVPNQMIQLLNTPERGGLLTMPGVLAMNRGPVLRGTWILERVLGDHLPEPPPDVGQVPGNKRGENLSFRERFELHRAQPTCAVCHDRIDPLGFALQNYGTDGSFRNVGARKQNKNEADQKNSQIDTSGRMPTGETFADFTGLKQILMTSQREQIVRTVVRRMMSYALCRRLQYYDRPAVDLIVKDIVDNDGTYRDLIHGIVNSLPFRQTVYRSQPSE